MSVLKKWCNIENTFWKHGWSCMSFRYI